MLGQDCTADAPAYRTRGGGAVRPGGVPAERGRQAHAGTPVAKTGFVFGVSGPFSCFLPCYHAVPGDIPAQVHLVLLAIKQARAGWAGGPCPSAWLQSISSGACLRCLPVHLMHPQTGVWAGCVAYALSEFSCPGPPWGFPVFLWFSLNWRRSVARFPLHRLCLDRNFILDMI